MNNTEIHLSFENRLNLNKEAGSMIHSFGDGLRVHRLIMATNLFGNKPREVVTLAEKDGVISTFGIHGNTNKTRKEYNTIVGILQDLENTPEGYVGFFREKTWSFLLWKHNVRLYIWCFKKCSNIRGFNSKSCEIFFIEFKEANSYHKDGSRGLKHLLSSPSE